MKFTIRKNIARYGDIDPTMPEEFTVEGMTMDQAEDLASDLSFRNAGCTDSYYVLEREI